MTNSENFEPITTSILDEKINYKGNVTQVPTRCFYST